MANPQSPIDPVQIKIANDLSKAITDINAAIESVNNGLNGVSKSLERISGLSKDVDTNSLTTMSDKLKSAGEQAQRLDGTNLGNISQQMNNASAATAALELKQSLLSKRTEATGKFLKGLGKGITIMSAVSKAATGVVSTLAQGLFSFGFAILAIPFHLFNSFIDMANKAGPGSTELAQAIEDIRKEFGKLEGPGPKTVRSMATELKGFSDTGLSAYQVFGNTAERLKYFLELGKSLGPLMNNFGKELKASGGAIAGYQKGLGLSNEEQRTVFEMAKTGGTSVIKVYEEMRTQAQNLGDQFGMDSKHIAREVAKGMKDLKHFAGATVKEISTAVVYANKLGLELEKITGILDAFETFDTAAENASKLSQAFGVNIDAFQMMESQDPAGPIEALRKQFAAAGVDASTFNRQQMKLLTSSTHLDETTARMAFSLQNQGMSMDEIRKKADANQKKQLTQAEAMKKLADNIERLVKPFEAMQGGFFSRFGQGIMRGIQSSAPFIKILNNINRGLTNATFAGVELGRRLVESFPGVKAMLEGIANFFDPKKYSRLFGGISRAIKILRTGSAEEMTQFKSQIDKSFGEFFASNKAAMGKIFENFKIFGKAVFHIFTGAIKFMIPEIVKFKDMIFNELKNPSEQTKAMRSWVAGLIRDASKFITEKVVPFASDILTSITNVLSGKGGKLPSTTDFGKFIGDTFDPLMTALWDGMTALWPRIKDLLVELVKKIGSLAWEVFSDAPWYMQLAMIFNNKLTTSIAGGLINISSNPAITGAISKGMGGILTKIGGSFGGGMGMGAGAVGGVLAAGAAGFAVGTLLAEEVLNPIVDAYIEKGKAIASAADKEHKYSIENIANQFDPDKKRALLDAEFKKIKEKEEKWFLSDAEKRQIEMEKFNLETQQRALEAGLKKAGGNKEAFIREQARIKAQQEIDTKNAINNAAQKEVKKKSVERSKEFLGPITAENAAERFKQLEDFSKKVLSKDFNLDKVVGQVREKINSIDFTIASEEKLKQVDSVLQGVSDIRNFFASLSEIVSSMNKTKKEMSQITQADANNAFISSGNIMNFINSVMQVFGAGEAKPGQPPPGPPIQAPKVNVVKGVFDSVGELFKTLGEVIKAITDVGKGFSTLPKQDDMTKGFTAINTTLTSFDSKLNIPDPTKLQGADKNLGLIHAALDNLAGTFGKISSIKFPDDISVIASFLYTGHLLTETKDTMQNLFNNLQNYFSGTFDANQISQFQTSILNAANAMTTTLNTIETSGLGPAVMAISNIIGKVNEVNTLLTNIPKISVDPVKMRMLASGLGLGGSAKYEINTKPIVVSVDIKVLLDAEQLERGLVLRKGSIIRDRINFATDTVVNGLVTSDSLPSNPKIEFANPAQEMGGLARDPKRI